jgi:lipopolysaccharide assembly protein A
LLNLLRTIGLVIVAVVATVFLVQNLATIEVAFLTWSIAAPRAVVFLIVFGLGLVTGYLLRALRPPRDAAPRDARSDTVRKQDGPAASNN